MNAQTEIYSRSLFYSCDVLVCVKVLVQKITIIQCDFLANFFFIVQLVSIDVAVNKDVLHRFF